MTREKVEKVASFSESNTINRRRFFVRTLGNVIRMEILFNLSLMTEGSRAPPGCLSRTSLYRNFHNFSWQKISKEISPRKTCAASSSQASFCRFIRLEEKNKKIAPDLGLLSFVCFFSVNRHKGAYSQRSETKMLSINNFFILMFIISERPTGVRLLTTFFRWSSLSLPNMALYSHINMKISNDEFQ